MTSLSLDYEDQAEFRLSVEVRDKNNQFEVRQCQVLLNALFVVSAPGKPPHTHRTYFSAASAVAAGAGY